MLNFIEISNTDSDDLLFIIATLVDTILSPMFGFLMIIWMSYRYYSLSQISNTKIKSLPNSFKFRAFLLLFLSFLNLVVVCLTSSSHFLLFDSEDPFAIITSGFMSFVLICEVNLMKY